MRLETWKTDAEVLVKWCREETRELSEWRYQMIDVLYQ